MDAQERQATKVSLIVAAMAVLATVVVIAVVAWRFGVLFEPTE